MELIGRELTEEIDRLIVLQIHGGGAAQAEKIELCKRNITDSLLAMDARKGVYKDDGAKHERAVSFWRGCKCESYGAIADDAGVGWRIWPRVEQQGLKYSCPKCPAPFGSIIAWEREFVK